MKLMKTIFFISSSFCMLFILACGGGGGSSDGSLAENGTVAVFLADGPADDYDSVILYVKKILLLPSASEPDRPNVTVFEAGSLEGYPVDLLKCRNQDFLFTVNNGVQTGYYERIRLLVTKIEAVGGPCENNIDIPNGKIDLVPDEGISVINGQALSIRLDVDVEKSFNLHLADNSEICTFQPVVFVDIKTSQWPSKCPRIVKGTIENLIVNNDTIQGIELLLDGNRGSIDVFFSQNVYLFDDSGFLVDVDALEPGLFVHIKGPLMHRDHLEAQLVVIGDVLDVSGIAATNVDVQDQFELLLDPGQELVGESVPVRVDQTVIMSGCGEVADKDDIQPWTNVDVVGKFNLQDSLVQAVAVLIDSRQIEGLLVSIVDSDSGYELEIIPDGTTDPVTVFLPDSDSIFLGNNGKISIGFLRSLIDDCAKTFQVRVKLDPAVTDILEADEVRVEAEKITGVVDTIGTDKIVEIKDDYGNTIRLQVQNNAKMIRHGKFGCEIIDFSAIEKGDRLTAFGLLACPDDPIADFFVFVIVLLPNGQKIFDLPEVVTENNEGLYLPAGTYNQSLTINGNSFILKGKAANTCSESGWTVITGDVIINGNETTFKNIKFEGNVRKNGNNAQFINCCFFDESFR